MARTIEDRVERLEDLAIQRGLLVQSLSQFQDLVVKPLVEQVEAIHQEHEATKEELAGYKGAFKMLAIVGSVLAFLITTALAIIAWKWEH